MAHFNVISAERHERGSPLWSYSNLDTEARAIELARALVLSGGAAFAIGLKDRCEVSRVRRVIL